MELFQSTEIIPLCFCLSRYTNSKVDKRKVDTPDELLTRKFDAAASIKKREDRFTQTTPDIHTRFVKCIEVDGGIFEN